MGRRHKDPERVGEVAVEGNSGDVREPSEPALYLSAIHREQAPACERLERGSHVRGHTRRRTADLDRPQGEERAFPRSAREQSKPEHERAARGKSPCKQMATNQPGFLRKRRRPRKRFRDRPHRSFVRRNESSSYSGELGGIGACDGVLAATA